MTDIGVVHMDTMSKGGGEAVCMNVLEALQDDYDVTLITLAEFERAELNAYFNTDVGQVSVRKAGYLAPLLHDTFGIKYYVLQNALLGRYARRHADEFDLLVSTINELGLEHDSVQYIHFPFDWDVNGDHRDEIFHPTIEDDGLYERLCTAVAGVSLADIRSNVLFANSPWTAEVVEEAYGTKPRVLYPPIDTSEFTDRAWNQRESGFVTVGRIERSKRIHKLIKIIDGLRERGHDQHLHVIGPTVDDEYYEELEVMADSRNYVFLEGEIPRSELVERICSHRYGIHGKTHEHFGMAVAELAAGGTVPFVPDSGGQRVIVSEDIQCYSSVEAAINQIDCVLTDSARQRELCLSSTEIQRRFGRDRFKAQIRATVAEVLDQSAERTISTMSGFTESDQNPND